MIGQLNAKRLLKSLKILPQFIIISGPAGSGKSLFIENICRTRLNCSPVVVTSVDDVRAICVDAPVLQEPCAYVLNNFDALNFRTKEAILKLCEEPPHLVYIFIETRNISKIKQTLLSRAFVFELQPYTKEELMTYCLSLNNLTDRDSELLVGIYNTPGRILQVSQYNTSKSFLSFCDTVVKNIATVPFSNALKISNKLKLKSDAVEGYDLDIFFETISFMALQQSESLGTDLAYNIIKSCSVILQKYSQVSTLNKQMLFDSWVMQIRGLI